MNNQLPTMGGHWIPHLLTPEQREEYEERFAIIWADNPDDLYADFAARDICLARWTSIPKPQASDASPSREAD